LGRRLVKQIPRAFLVGGSKLLPTAERIYCELLFDCSPCPWSFQTANYQVDIRRIYIVHLRMEVWTISQLYAVFL
jgi:hypothetical protein